MPKSQPAILSMGHFTAVGMRVPIGEPGALIINTCSDNDKDCIGDLTHWSWSNPTNRLHPVYCSTDPTVMAVSTECLWQGTKIFSADGKPDPLTLNGDWRRGKAKRPIGAWNGPDLPLITNPGEARRKIYIPAYRNQVEMFLNNVEVRILVDQARQNPGPVFLRDWDTGRGIDRNGPMSHAWVLAYWLNEGKWPD